ncbi:hypothetical protein LXL04_014914 [Taraxacum kok-saghyz]
MTSPNPRTFPPYPWSGGVTEISKSKKLLDAAAIYEGYPTFFSITLHHGGKFTKFRGRTYIDGKVDYVKFIDMDEFSVHELDYMMQQLGYEVPPVIYYHFQIPNGDFDFGLSALGNDLDLLTLGKFIEDNKVIHVYTEHGETRLLTYFMSPRVKPRVVIEELDNVDAMDNLNHEKEGERLDFSLVLFRSPEYSKQRKANHGEGSSSSRKLLCFNAQEDLNVQDEVLVFAPYQLWPKSNCPFTLTPPPHHTQPGRPKVKRKRSADEKSLSQSQGKRLTRKFVSVRCGKCKNRGHNSRSCKGQGGN